MDDPVVSAPEGWTPGEIRVPAMYRPPGYRFSAADWRERGTAIEVPVGAFVRGQLALHPTIKREGERGSWTLSATTNGGAIEHDTDLSKLVALADKVADLDWSGDGATVGKRNARAVTKARAEVFGAY